MFTCLMCMPNVFFAATSLTVDVLAAQTSADASQAAEAGDAHTFTMADALVERAQEAW